MICELILYRAEARSGLAKGAEMLTECGLKRRDMRCVRYLAKVRD